LKQVQPDTGISTKAMAVMNDILGNVYRGLLATSRELIDALDRVLITSREIQTSVRLNFPGELAKHAVSEGTKAVMKFNSGPASAAGGLERRGRSSKSSRAGLHFPVGAIQRAMRQILPGYRFGAGAPVYLTAVLEYICAEVLELSGNASKDLRVRRVTPRHLRLAISGDEELDILIPGVVAGGGVIPHIHKSLVRKDFGAGNAQPFLQVAPTAANVGAHKGGFVWGATPAGFSFGGVFGAQNANAEGASDDGSSGGDEDF